MIVKGERGRLQDMQLLASTSAAVAAMCLKDVLDVILSRTECLTGMSALSVGNDKRKKRQREIWYLNLEFYTVFSLCYENFNVSSSRCDGSVLPSPAALRPSSVLGLCLQ